eukprot:12419548-Karenia_brevis.AAC.1
MCRKCWTQKAARALDRRALTALRDAGKSRAIPAQLEVGSETEQVRAEWQAAMANYYKEKCNGNVTDREHADRLAVLLFRGRQEMIQNWLQRLVIGMTVLLQSLASLAKGRGVAPDG